MTDTKVKIRPSSSGFKRGDMISTSYSSGCLRYMKAARLAKYIPIDPIYAEVGLVHEENYELKLGDRLADREFTIKKPLWMGAEYSGRCDFIDISGAVHETKATLSKSSKASIIDNGEVNLNHLAQLVSYLEILNTPIGYIAVGYYEKIEDGYKLIAERIFKIEIIGGYYILIDGIEHTNTVSDYWEHVSAQIKLDTIKMPPRPFSMSKFKSPCGLCPLAETCDSVDIGEISDIDFISKSVDILNNTVPRAAKPNIYKPKKGKTK